jgi:hypothetical protein
LATSKGCRSVARRTSLQIPHPIPLGIPVLPCAIAPRRRHLDVSGSELNCGARGFVDTWRRCCCERSGPFESCDPHQMVLPLRVWLSRLGRRQRAVSRRTLQHPAAHSATEETGMPTGMGRRSCTDVQCAKARHAVGMANSLVDEVMLGAGISGLYATRRPRNLHGLSGMAFRPVVVPAGRAIGTKTPGRAGTAEPLSWAFLRRRPAAKVVHSRCLQLSREAVMP